MSLNIWHLTGTQSVSCHLHTQTSLSISNMNILHEIVRGVALEAKQPDNIYIGHLH